MEAVIGLSLVGVIGAATVGLLISQDRFYSRVDDTVSAQQNLRVAADLASTELRMTSPDDLLAAEADSVSTRFDVSQAVVCGSLGGNSVAMLVYDSVPNPNINAGVFGTAYSQPYEAFYHYRDGWTGSVTVGSAAARTSCLAALSPDTTPGLYRAVSGGWGAGGWSPASPGVPPRGSIVRRYRQLSYRFAPSVIGTDFALFRGTQELVGPLDATSSFSYVMEDGTVRNSVIAADMSDVRTIRINAVAVDDDPRFDIQRTLQLDVPLRN